MKFRVCLLLVCSALLLCGQEMQMNVQQLADFVRSELALRQHTDKQVAAYIKTKISLSERLTDKTILDLEAQGAGPKTVQALQELRDKTAAMKPPTHDATSSPATAPDNTLSAGPATASMHAQAPPIPPPSSVKQREILDRIKQYAMAYTDNLPNFVCVEVTRRYIDPNAGDHYRSLGSVLSKVSYNEGQEKYDVFSVNGHYEQTTLEKAAATGGAISNGEFGSMMRQIIAPESEAEFGWERWATLRGRLMAVFNFFIDSGHSKYSIEYAADPHAEEQRIVTAYKGLIFADADTGEVDRITLTAVDIPRSFPVSSATEILDYDAVDINGHPSIVPLAAKLYMTAGREKSKNEIEFRDYRKFGTESDIIYGKEAPPPLPDSATEEQPATTATPKNTARTAQGTSANSGSSPWWAPMSVPPPPPPTTKPPQ